MMPGEEEQGTNGGGGGGGGGAAAAAAAAGAAGAAAGAAAVTCDCVPRYVRISNAQPVRRGVLYGHSFDVSVLVNYVAAPAGRAGRDAQLIWRETSDRPPAWYGVGANTWVNLFPLFPASPTFAGWTANRAKPCPGQEIATMTDEPLANVNLPARTIDFDIYVEGLQISHNARARQVLEPDGRGGVRTQTFTILASALGPGAR